MQAILVTGLLFGLAASLIGCDEGFFCSHEGSGSMKTILLNISDYTKVTITSDIEAEIAVGSTPGVSISIHENVAEYLNVHVEFGSLLLAFKDNSGVCNSGAKAVVTVAEPLQGVTSSGEGSSSVGKDVLSGASVSILSTGSGALAVDSGEATQGVDVSSSGSGSLTIGHLNGTSVSIQSTGSGALTVDSGESTQSVEVSTTGSGALKLGSLKTSAASIHSSGSGSVSGMISEYLKIESTGSGSIQTTVTGTAGGSCSGSGSVSVTGNPEKSGNCFGRRLRAV